MTDEVVTKKDLRRLFALSPSTIDRLEKAGRLPKSFKLTQHPNSKRMWWKHEVAEFFRSLRPSR